MAHRGDLAASLGRASPGRLTPAFSHTGEGGREVLPPCGAGLGGGDQGESKTSMPRVAPFEPETFPSRFSNPSGENTRKTRPDRARRRKGEEFRPVERVRISSMMGFCRRVVCTEEQPRRPRPPSSRSKPRSGSLYQRWPGRAATRCRSSGVIVELIRGGRAGGRGCRSSARPRPAARAARSRCYWRGRQNSGRAGPRPGWHRPRVRRSR